MDHSYHQKLYILKCRFDFQVSNSSRETCQLSSTRPDGVDLWLHKPVTDRLETLPHSSDGLNM